MTSILVVDDERQLRRALGVNLRARGYDVALAETGAQALDLAARHRPDVVILDLGLPDLDGAGGEDRHVLVDREPGRHLGLELLPRDREVADARTQQGESEGDAGERRDGRDGRCGAGEHGEFHGAIVAPGRDTRSAPRRPAPSAGPHEPGLVGAHDGLGAVTETELAQQVGHVALDGVLAQDQRLGDLGVRAAASEVAQDLRLANRQLGEAGGGFGGGAAHVALDQAPGDRRGEQRSAAGDDPESARLAGINTRNTLIGVYTLAGFICALAGWIIIGRIGAASPLAGQDANLDAITAVVIGGTSLFGGRGSILGTILGALIVGVFRNGLALAGLDSLWQEFTVGILIIVAVTIDQWIRKISA